MEPFLQHALVVTVGTLLGVPLALLTLLRRDDERLLDLGLGFTGGVFTPHEHLIRGYEEPRHGAVAEVTCLTDSKHNIESANRIFGTTTSREKRREGINGITSTENLSSTA